MVSVNCLLFTTVALLRWWRPWRKGKKHRSGVSLSVCLFVFQQQQRESSGDASVDLEPAASVRFGRTVRGPIHVRDVEHCLRLRDEALRNRIKCVRARQTGLD